jgi:hypothetical protein
VNKGKNDQNLLDRPAVDNDAYITDFWGSFQAENNLVQLLTKYVRFDYSYFCKDPCFLYISIYSEIYRGGILLAGAGYF